MNRHGTLYQKPIVPMGNRSKLSEPSPNGPAGGGDSRPALMLMCDGARWITCTICTRLHLVDPKTGNVLAADEDKRDSVDRDSDRMPRSPDAFGGTGNDYPSLQRYFDSR